jgi:hypothetical protein
MSDYSIFNTTTDTFYIKKAGKNQTHILLEGGAMISVDMDANARYRVKRNRHIVAKIRTDIIGYVEKYKNCLDVERKPFINIKNMMPGYTRSIFICKKIHGDKFDPID